jgi:hypothetical protein
MVDSEFTATVSNVRPANTVTTEGIFFPLHESIIGIL